MKQITFENLEAFGMSAPTDGSEIIYPLEKILGEVTFEGEDDPSVMALLVTRERNVTEIALKIPGGTIFLNCESIEDLEVIERCISSFEPNY